MQSALLLFYTSLSNFNCATTDADGYVIPNLLTQDNDVIEPSIPKAKDPEPLQVCSGMLF
jgi:hypothetical protein